MGFNLRQKLEETFADINPFDNGATAQTVRANRAKAAPAQTVKTQTLTFQKPQKIEPTFTLNQPKPATVKIAQPNTMSQPQIKVAQQIQSNPANIRVQKPQFNTPTQAPQMLTPQAQKQWYQGKQDQQILAKGTVKQGQQVIQRQMDDTKRVKLDPLFKQGKSFEDMAKTAGYSNDEVRKFAERNYKGYGDQGLLGNVARETGKFVGTMVDNAAGIVRKPIVTINTALNRDKLKNDLATINKDLYGGNISPAAAQERANLLTKDLIGEKAYQDPQTGMYRIGAQNVAEFGGSFAQQGLDTGSVLPFAGGAASGASKIAQAVGRPGVQAGLEKAASVLTAGAQTQATSKLAQSLAAKGMSPQTANLLGNAITSNAKQSAVWGTAQTGTDVASGRGITPESLAMNYGADFLMGAVPEIGLGSVARGLDVTNARVHDGMVAQNPRYAQLAKSYETTTSPTAKAAIERQMTAIRKRAGEGGFIGGQKATGFADAQAQGRVFTDTPDGMPRFEVDDSGAKLLSPTKKATATQVPKEIALQKQQLRDEMIAISGTGDMNKVLEISSKLKALDAQHPEQFVSKQTYAKDILDHPKLYEQYPELKGVEVQVKPLNGKNGYSTTDKAGRPLIVLDSTTMKNDPNYAKGTLLHELQHVIQNKEKFAGGSSDPNFELYRNSAGEAEARLVQKRMDMTPAERAKTPVYDSLDVPKKDLIVKKDSDTANFTERGRTPKTIHPEDQNVMTDFIDYQNGVYRPSPKAAHELEIDAARIAERYGLDMPNTAKKLAGVFDKRLQQDQYAGVAYSIDAPKNDPTAALKAEALKYKTAEEFVRAQGESVYHGTPHQFDEFKVGANDYSTNRNAGIGTWFSNKKDVADQFTYDSIYLTNDKTKNGRVIEAYTGLKNPKVFETPKNIDAIDNKITSVDEQIARVNNDRKIYKDGFNSGKHKYDWQTDRGFTTRIEELEAKKKDLVNSKKDSYDIFQYEADRFSNKKEFVDNLKKQGYDGIVIKNTGADANGGLNDQIVVFDPSQIKTKQQLTDLYNQAHTPQPKPEAAQPKPVAQAKVEVPKQPTPFEQDLKKAGLGTEPDAYRKQPKAETSTVKINKPTTVDEYVANGMGRKQAEKIVADKKIVSDLNNERQGTAYRDGENLDVIAHEDNRIDTSTPGRDVIQTVTGYKDMKLDNGGTYRRPQVVTETVDHTPETATKRIAQLEQIHEFQGELTKDLANELNALKAKFTDTLRTADNPAQQLSPEAEINAIHKRANASRNGKLTMTEKNRIAGLRAQLTKDQPATTPASQKTVSPEPSEVPVSPAQSSPKPSKAVNQSKASPKNSQLSRSDQSPDNLGRSSTKNPTNEEISQYVSQQVKAQKVETKVGVKERLTNLFDQTRHTFVDDAVGYERYIKDKGTRQAIRERVDRVRGSDMIARQFADDNGMREIGKMNTGDLNEFQQYLIAKRANELSARGMKTGRDQGLDNALIKQAGNKFGKQEKIVRDYSRAMLDYSVDNGLISDELRDSLLKESPNYVPMNRVFDELEKQGMHKSKQLGNLSKQTVVQKLEGSDRVVDNPIESLIRNTTRMANEAERNQAARLLASSDAFSENVIKEGVKPRPGYDTLHYLDNGKKVTVEVPALVAQEMKNLNSVIPDWLDTTIKVVGLPTKMLRTGATSANPIFALSNVVRDQLQTTITGNVKANVKGASKAAKAAFGVGAEADALRAELRRNGIVGNTYRQTYGYKSGDLMREIQNTSKLSKRTIERLKHPIDAIADIIGTTENFTRAQQYFGTDGTAIQKAQAARNNTLNFSRAGSLGRQLNKVIPFINAGIQGGRITVNQFATRPVRTSAAFATFAGIAMAARAMNESDEKKKELYARLGEEEKKNNLIWFTGDAKYNPDTNRVEGIVKIPMPQMLYPLLDGANNVKGEPEDLLKLAGDIFTATTGIDAKNPLNQLTPTAVKPLLEAGLNKSTYTGNDLVSEYEKNKNPEDKGAQYSSGVARAVAKTLGVDAPVVDNFISNWGGGLAKDLAKGLSDNPDNKKDGGGVVGIFDQGFTRRFLSGSVTSQYDIQAGLAKGYKDTLKNDRSFQSLSAEDQAKVLDKIDYDTKAVAGIAAKTEQNRGGEIKRDLTDRQRKLIENGFDPSQYTNLDAKTTSTKELPKNLTGSARTILEKYDSLDTDTRKKWNTEKNTDAEVTKTMQSWIGDKVKVPEVTNEIAKKWADYQSDYVDGKISKLNMNDKKKAILKDAFNSQLSTDEKEIASLSKAELQHYYTNGVITDENINKAIAVEKQLFEAGLIAKETLQRSLGVSARGYKGSTAKKSSGKGSKVAKGKFDYKLNGFGTPSASNSKQLHDLLKKATMRVSA